jgi:hypothetical protein
VESYSVRAVIGEVAHRSRQGDCGQPRDMQRRAEEESPSRESCLESRRKNGHSYHLRKCYHLSAMAAIVQVLSRHTPTPQTCNNSLDSSCTILDR